MHMKKISILLLYSWKVFSVFEFKLFLRSLTKFPRRLSVSMSYFLKSSTTNHLPTNLQIELTNVCNLNCVMCPTQKQTRKRGFLSKEDFAKILDSYGASLEILDFDFMGETLIHPEYDWFIQEAKKRGIKTAVSTNATFLTKEHSQRIIDSGLDHLIISIDDVQAGKYDEIRKGAKISTVFANTKQFLEMNQGKVFTVIQKIHMSVNKNSTWSYIEEMLPLGANIVRLKPFRDLDHTKKHLRTSSIKNVEKIQCPYLWRVPIVTWDGKLVPCSVDYDASVVLGELPENLSEAWNGEKFQAMRQMHIDGRKEEIDICRGCSAIEAKPLSVVISSVFDGLNFRKVLSLTQTLKILLKEYNS